MEVTSPKRSEKPLYQALLEAWQAKQNCEQRAVKSADSEKWSDYWSDRVEELRDSLPSGSGFDSGSEIESVSRQKIVIRSSYHKLSEHGFYIGWLDFKLVIRPEFDGIALKVIGQNGSRIDALDREFFEDEFYAALTQLI